MEVKEILSKIKNDFYNYDLTDSIIESIQFTENLMDLKIIVDYYFTEKEEEHIALLFKKCTAVNYSLKRDVYELNHFELNYSQFTITKVKVEQIKNQIVIKIFTVNDENEFLEIICQDVYFS